MLHYEITKTANHMNVIDGMCANLINGTKILVNKCVLIHIGK